MEQFNPSPDRMEDTIDLREYLLLLRRWAWLIVLCTVLAGLAAFVISRLMTPVYEATTTLLISQPPSTNTSEYNALLLSERLAKTYAQMLTRRPVLEGVIQDLGLPYTPKELGDSINVKQVPNTQLIEVSVEDPSPARAAAIANALVDTFKAQVGQIEAERFGETRQTLEQQIQLLQQDIQKVQNELTQLAPEEESRRIQLEAALNQYNQTYTSLLKTYENFSVLETQSASKVYQVEPATPPERPVRPRVLLNTLLAAIVGAMLAVGAVFLIQALDTSIKSPSEVTALFQLPVLAFVPDLSAAAHASNHKNSAAPIIQPRSPEAEAYRALRANLEFISPDHPLKTLLISSPGSGEGKSLTAINLAHILAQGGRRVVLLDCDMHKPSVHKKLEISNHQGLSSVFRGTPIEQVIQPVGDHLAVITTGRPLPPNPAELLGSEKMRQILQQLRQDYDYVLLDGPPGFISDSTYLATLVDGVLLVALPGSTDRNALSHMLEQMQRVGARVAGIVFNRVSARDHHYAYYTNHYKYYQREEAL